MSSKTIMQTSLGLEGSESKYIGKVREVYRLKDKRLVMVATDRLSAFDVVLPKGIPYKGQILNQIATQMMEATADIVPNWLEATPDPNVAVGKLCEPFKVEMVIRGYLSGHAARTYKAGGRILCGVPMPEGMKENDRFETPIITPATKAEAMFIRLDDPFLYPIGKIHSSTVPARNRNRTKTRIDFGGYQIRIR